ncbi:Uncharacterised protein [Legionella pneumophila]|nr:Uncharacterised protein [Legionella pneumophila]
MYHFLTLSPPLKKVRLIKVRRFQLYKARIQMYCPLAFEVNYPFFQVECLFLPFFYALDLTYIQNHNIHLQLYF